MIPESISRFLEDEDLAMKQARQGDFFPSNHHVLKPDFKKALKRLPAEVIRDYYFHSLRISNFPLEVTESSLPLLLEAYRKMIVLFKESARYPINSFRKFEGLLLFGFDGVHVEEAPDRINIEVFNERHALFKKARQYSNLPGMLTKIEKLREFSNNDRLVTHIHHILRKSNFIHDGVFASDFLFWASMAVVMLHKCAEWETTRAQFSEANLPDDKAHREIFARFVSAIEQKP